MKKKLVAVGAAALLATGGLLAATVSPAQAAAGMTLSNEGPFEGGEKVTVTLTGFTPNAPVALGQIPASRYPAEGPGDACASKLGCSALLVADANGGLTKEITIVKGSIENSKAPVETCDAENACVIGAANINDAAETVKVDITFAGAPAPVEEAAAPAPAAPAPETVDSVAETGTLPQTGPREIAIAFAIGLVLFQAGLVFAVRAVRKSPRRVVA